MTKQTAVSCGYVEVIHETHYYIKSILEIILTGRNIQRLIFVQNHSTLTGMVFDSFGHFWPPMQILSYDRNYSNLTSNNHLNIILTSNWYHMNMEANS